jgi:hypothetical protein
MTGGTGFIAAAYLFAALILGAYSVGLARRLRRERTSSRMRDFRHGPPGPAGAAQTADRKQASMTRAK